MTAEAKLICFIVRHLCLEYDKSHIVELLSVSDFDWEVFIKLSLYHEIAPFAYLALRDISCYIPSDKIELLENSYYCSLSRGMLLQEELSTLRGLFEKAGIPMLALKGAAFLCTLYSRLPIRQMTDIDILVRKCDIEDSERIVSELEYRKELYGLRQEYWRECQYSLAFYKNGAENIFIELHWDIDYKRKTGNLLSEFWDRAVEISWNDKVIKTLSPEDTLLCLALHNRRLGRVLSLKNIYDLVLLLKEHRNNFDWNYCLDMGKKYMISSAIFFILYQIYFLSSFGVPDYVFQGLGLPVWKRSAIRFFIERHTFARGEMNIKKLYLFSHFLLYDSFSDPVGYIYNIPKEQFAKFYCLEPYCKRTGFLYRNRIWYMTYKALTGNLRNAG